MARRAHCTDTVDVVAGGEIWLEQDDEEVALRRGDVVIQHGALHMWRNRSDEPCLVYHIVFGTTRSERRVEARGCAVL